MDFFFQFICSCPEVAGDREEFHFQTALLHSSWVEFWNHCFDKFFQVQKWDTEETEDIELPIEPF